MPKRKSIARCECRIPASSSRSDNDNHKSLGVDKIIVGNSIDELQ
jgi:hypothetical protein